jgi:hypothetical protein
MLVRRPRAVVQVVCRLVTTGLASISLLSCANLGNLAAETYRKDRGDDACAATARARPDLESPGDSDTYEVTGCGKDVIYRCIGARTPRGHDTIPAHCARSSDQCAEPGCDSFELAARNAFKKEKACPLEKVSASAHAPVSGAPPEVAADPERLRVWTESHPEYVDVAQPRTFMLATGCESKTVYKCWRPPGIQTVPMCEAVANQ